MDSTTSVSRGRGTKLGFSVPWWLYLITGAAWFVIAWVVLRFDLTSVAAVSVLAGVVILAGRVGGALQRVHRAGWRWLHAILGVVFIITSGIAFFRPGGTFAMLAAFVGWYLLFKGMLDIILAFATKAENDAWWLGLIVGIIEVCLGFWAAGRFGRSVALLIVFVGAIALTRGITDIVLAFRLRQAAAPMTMAGRPAASPHRRRRRTGGCVMVTADTPLPRPPTGTRYAIGCRATRSRRCRCGGAAPRYSAASSRSPSG